MRAIFLGFFVDANGDTHGAFLVTVRGGGFSGITVATNSNQRTATLTLPPEEDPAVTFMNREKLKATLRPDLQAPNNVPTGKQEVLELALCGFWLKNPKRRVSV